MVSRDECCGFLGARLVPLRMRTPAFSLFAAFFLSITVAGVAAEPTDVLVAERLLTALSTETSDALIEPVRRAKAAVDRAAQLRAIGDGPRATLAEAEARAWAEYANEIAKVSHREAEAAEARTKVQKLAESEKRSRADYEMLSRQVLRLRTEVARVESEPIAPLEKSGPKRAKRKGGH